MIKFASEKNLPFLRSAAQSLQDENRRLRQERHELEAVKTAAEDRVALLEIEKTEWVAEKAELEALKAQQDEALEKLRQELHVLKEQLDRRNRRLFGRKSERHVIEGSDQKEENNEKPQRKRKKQRGHGPTAQPKLPRVKVTHELVGDDLLCGNCGETLQPMGTEAEESELVAIHQRIIQLEEHIRTKYQCPCCHTGVKVAPGSTKLIPGGRYALNFSVEVAYMKYFANVPLDRQVHMMKHEGLQVRTSTLWDQVDALVTALTPTYQAILRIVQAEPVLRADETPWAVLSNGHTQNERFYAWVAVGSEYVAYCLLDTRSKDGARTILGSFSGTLMVDGLTSYPAAAKAEPGEAPRFTVANCWVHTRRGFIECQKYYPAESGVILDLIRQLYEVEREGKLPDADLGLLRDQRSRPLVNAIFVWGKEQQNRSDILPSSGLIKAVNYLMNHEAGLRVFLENPAVPIDNNASEAALRNPVIGRKISYGSRSRRGTEAAAVLYTLVESAKKVGVNPKAYLEAAAEYALSKAGAILLPDEFKRQLEDLSDIALDSA